MAQDDVLLLLCVWLIVNTYIPRKSGFCHAKTRYIHWLLRFCKKTNNLQVQGYYRKIKEKLKQSRGLPTTKKINMMWGTPPKINKCTPNPLRSNTKTEKNLTATVEPFFPHPPCLIAPRKLQNTCKYPK